MRAVFLRGRALTASLRQYIRQSSLLEIHARRPAAFQRTQLVVSDKQGQETFASLALDETPLQEERQVSSHGWLGTLIWVLICFFLQPEQSRILPLLWKGTGCTGPKAEQLVSCASGNAWADFAVITVNTLPSTRSCAIDFAPFCCHQDSVLPKATLEKCQQKIHCTSTYCSESSWD